MHYPPRSSFWPHVVWPRGWGPSQRLCWARVERLGLVNCKQFAGKKALNALFVCPSDQARIGLNGTLLALLTFKSNRPTYLPNPCSSSLYSSSDSLSPAPILCHSSCSSREPVPGITVNEWKSNVNQLHVKPQLGQVKQQLTHTLLSFSLAALT